jgi:hypothetical protein
MNQAEMADQAAIFALELAELCRAEDYETIRLLLDMARLDTAGQAARAAANKTAHFPTHKARCPAVS